MWTLGVFVFLLVVLCVHIYIVTRPKVPDAHTLTMARIDIKQPIDQGDSTKITQWLYTQPGVDHVYCNPSSAIVVFTFHPVTTSANLIVDQFKSNLPYKAVRFIPSKEDLQGGCPVASNSVSYKVYHFFNHLF